MHRGYKDSHAAGEAAAPVLARTVRLSRKQAKKAGQLGRLVGLESMDTRDRKQTGHIYRRGNWWVLRYRVRGMRGRETARRPAAKRLAPVGADHKTKASVRHLAVVALEPSTTTPFGGGGYHPW